VRNPGDGLALAIPIAALITAPIGIGHVGAVDVRSLGIGLVIAVGGLIIPFALELEASAA
jgi:threonine/homoserine efflux transporter RhtA